MYLRPTPRRAKASLRTADHGGHVEQDAHLAGTIGAARGTYLQGVIVFVAALALLAAEPRRCYLITNHAIELIACDQLAPAAGRHDEQPTPSARADVGYVLVSGKIALASTGQELVHDADVGRLFLGG